jgi:hypothetical protein
MVPCVLAIDSRADFMTAVQVIIRAPMECNTLLTLRREVNKPAFYFRAVLLQPGQEFCGRLVGVRVDGSYFVTCLKVGYAVSQTFPDRDPLGPQVIEEFMAAPVRSASGQEHSSGGGGSEARHYQCAFKYV